VLSCARPRYTHLVDLVSQVVSVKTSPCQKTHCKFSNHGCLSAGSIMQRLHLPDRGPGNKAHGVGTSSICPMTILTMPNDVKLWYGWRHLHRLHRADGLKTLLDTWRVPASNCTALCMAAVVQPNLWGDGTLGMLVVFHDIPVAQEVDHVLLCGGQEQRVHPAHTPCVTKRLVQVDECKAPMLINEDILAMPVTLHGQQIPDRSQHDFCAVHPAPAPSLMFQA
jgi:hypothetical protein